MRLGLCLEDSSFSLKCSLVDRQHKLDVKKPHFPVTTGLTAHFIWSHAIMFVNAS